jgi:ferric-dicitrate binding protein FerR (iron transport regulator)
MGLFALLRPAPPIPVATVVRVSGEVMRRVERRGPAQALIAGVTLRVGESIETSAQGRALVRWTDSAVLRFDSGSSARLESPHKVRLTRGAVYVEMDGRQEGPGLAFQTPLGEVRHLGTRFEVRVEPGAVRVRVRDGLAVFASNYFAPVIIEAGRQLVVGSGSPRVEEGPDLSDPAWSWTQSIGPTFAIEGRSLFEAVEWLAHEAGLRVIYASPAVRERTRSVVLHGSIEGLDLEQALTAVLSGSGATYQLRQDRIEIREAGPQ